VSRLITAQRTPNILVSNIEGAGDPSLGLNPVKVRTGFARQNLPEVSRIGGVYTRTFEYGRTFDRRSPGTHTLLGKLTGVIDDAWIHNRGIPHCLWPGKWILS
jgi:hypothetical protein